MIKKILLDGRLISYDLQRKKVKNINIRVKRDLSVHVSASPKVTQREIDKILTEKSAFILSALEKYEKLTQTDKQNDLTENSVSVFGHKLPILIINGKKNQATIEENQIILALKDVTDTALRQKTLQSALDSLLRETVDDICRQVYPKFSGFCPEFPTIKYRHMISRWGSCNFKKNILTFNYSLIYAPRECIEYVVYHEFTHFIHPNHSADFYKELSKYIAEHATLRKQLNGINIKQ